jgi:Ca-activated chloride channel homolog
MQLRIIRHLSLVAVIAIVILPSIPAQEPNKTGQSADKAGAISTWVSAFDAQKGLALDLAKEHFKIYEDGVAQSITGFRKGATQASIGILFDVSSSMNEDSNIIKKVILNFVESRKPIEEYFMVMFDKNLTLVPSNSQGDPTQQQATLKHEKRTSLYDAIYAGFDQIKNKKYDIAALIIISDGEDTSSKHNFSEIYKLAKDSGIQIYIIGKAEGYRFEVSRLINLVKVTGGRAYFSPAFKELDYYLDLIRKNLHSQYLLTYTPSNLKHDGKWREMKIEVPVPKKSPKPILSFKQGYYAQMD